MYLKIHESKNGRIVAVCDEELIGKVLEDKDRVMDLDRYRGFYVGEKANEDQVVVALKKFSSLNIVGKKSVAAALRTVNADVMYIKKIPYIQMYKI